MGGRRRLGGGPGRRPGVPGLPRRQVPRVRSPHRRGHHGRRRDRGGHPPERVPHPRRQLGDRPAHHRRAERLEAQLAPVGVVAARTSASSSVARSAGSWISRVSMQAHSAGDIRSCPPSPPSLPLQEAAHLVPARRAAEQTRGDDDQQQRHRVQRLVDALLPVLAPGDVVAVLEDGEFLAGLRPDLRGEPFPELRELAVVVLIVEADMAHERRGLHRHGIPLPSQCVNSDTSTVTGAADAGNRGRTEPRAPVRRCSSGGVPCAAPRQKR
ncbi:hypothetical protein SGLAM104S_07720 [Streptomyces glaucescens]